MGFSFASRVCTILPEPPLTVHEVLVDSVVVLVVQYIDHPFSGKFPDEKGIKSESIIKMRVSCTRPSLIPRNPLMTTWLCGSACVCIAKVGMVCRITTTSTRLATTSA